MTKERTQAKPLLKIALEFVPRSYPSFDRLLPTLTAGVVNGITDVTFVTSLGALIFSGPLTIFVARGIGLEFISAVVMCVTVAVFSSFEGTIGIPQDSPAAICLIPQMTGVAAKRFNSGQCAHFPHLKW